MQESLLADNFTFLSRLTKPCATLSLSLRRRIKSMRAGRRALDGNLQLTRRRPDDHEPRDEAHSATVRAAACISDLA